MISNIFIPPVVRSVAVLFILTAAGAILTAQEVAPPPAPVDLPGDPPLLPSDAAPPALPSTLKRAPAPSDLPPGLNEAGAAKGSNDAPSVSAAVPTDLPGQDGSVVILADNSSIGIAPLAGVAANHVTARPELVIDAGGFAGPVHDVAISPDNKTIAASGEKIVRIIDVESGEVLKTLRGDRSRTAYGGANGVAFSPDGSFLVVGVHDDQSHGSIRLYRTDHLDEIHALLPGLDSPCAHVEFSRDGKFMATSDGDGQIVLWDWNQRRILKKIPGRNPDKPIIDALQFADQEPYLVSVEHDGPHVYRVPDGVEISANEYMPPKMLGWMFDVLSKKVAWPFPMKQSPRTFEMRLDRDVWAAAGVGTQNGASRPWVGLWTARSMNQQSPQTTAGIVYKGHRWEVFTISLSSDGRFAVSGDKFGEVHIWDAKTGKRIHKITGQGKAIYQAAFSTTDGQIVFGTKADTKNWGFNSYGVVSHVLDLKQRSIRKREPTSNSIIDEQKSANGGTARLVMPAAGEQAYHVAFSKGGPEQKYRIPSGRIPSCYTVLPEEKLGVSAPVLISDNLGFLALWDSSGDELRRQFRGHESMVTSISPSSNGKIFVTGSTDRTIRVWSLQNQKPTGIFDFKYENSSVIKVVPGSSSAQAGVQIGDRIVSFDGHTLDKVYELMLYDRFTYTPGQTVRVVMKRGEQEYDYQMKLDVGFDFVEPLLNVFIGDNNQWIIWTPKGYYDCSPGADQLIGWHVNRGPTKSAKFYRVQQFRQQLYRPDIINNIIETGTVADAERLSNDGRGKRAAPINLSDRTDFAAHQPPIVSITSPQDQATFEDARVTIDAVVNSANQLPIKNVTLLHNGTPARVFKPRGAEQASEFPISHRLKLFPGRNEISFIAENSAATSDPQDCRIILTSPATKTKSKVYVLSIGISEYANKDNGVTPLKFAANDATKFAEAVTQHSNGRLYNGVETKMLLNTEANRGNVLDGLQWLVDNVEQGDVVMLFCSGHGFLDDRDNFYLGTHEVDPKKLRSTGVPWREIVSILHEELPACRRLVFLDACHAAGIGGPNSHNPLHDLAAPELGTVFYASCTMQQKSFERDDWRHGAFTKAILDVLADSASDISPKTGDGLVSTTELALGVTEKVSTMTGDRQNPVVHSPDRLKRVNILEFKN